MIKNNRNNEQIYGRNDMIMLDPNNKIYGSLGLADNYVMKTEEGTRLTLNNPKQGRFADVLTEFNIYGRSEQFSTTGVQLFNENIEIKNRGVTIKINGSTATFVGTVSDESNFRVNYQKKIKLKPGKYTASSSNEKIVADFSVKKANDEIIYNSHIEIDGTEEVKIRVLFGLRPSAKGDIINETTNIMLNDGDIALPYEPYTGGKPSPSLDYPQEIKSVVNPIVKVTNEDGLKVQSVTFNNITLNAIPVTSGGNVTINGQQWICDEVDLERGVKVQRVKSVDISSLDKSFWIFRNDIDANVSATRYSNEAVIVDFRARAPAMSNILPAGVGNDVNTFRLVATPLYLYQFNLDSSKFPTVKSWVEYLEANTVLIIYALATPIETQLTPAEIAAFNVFTTYYPVTIVENNYNTWMKATYKSTESV
jgi:hypothetical protein